MPKKLYMETRPLTEQYDFYAYGDLMFAECSDERRTAFADRVEAELDHAAANSGTFRDGSRFEPGTDGASVMDKAIQKKSEEARKPVPGPFDRDAHSRNNINRGKTGYWVARIASHLTEPERVELVDLLNKGTHFDALLADMQLIVDAAGNVEEVAATDNTAPVRFARIINRIATSAIAKAEGGRDDG